MIVGSENDCDGLGVRHPAFRRDAVVATPPDTHNQAVPDKAFQEIHEFSAIEVCRNSFVVRSPELVHRWQIIQGKGGFSVWRSVQSEQVLDVVPVEPRCTAGVVAVVQFNEYILKCWLGTVLWVATASADPRVLSRTAGLW
ncbi:hypothetical protein FBY36_3573 [Arthrobacter sp. SLBN-122]|nr:hypothetical protein FBY36_3573 [Arthrobacter sp. SLBN-122]